MNELVLVTGASGFIGNRVLSAAMEHGLSVRAAIRSPEAAARLPKGTDYRVVGDLGPETNWSPALDTVGVVIHLAGRAHKLNEAGAEKRSLFIQVNTQGTLRLASEAASAGVKRFVFVSSIGVNGNVTTGQPFSETDTPRPVSAYAISKWEAEQGLRRLEKETGIEIVVVRPPLVYGPDAPGNFERLVRLIQRGIPLPLRSVENQRSFIAVENLVDLLVHCGVHPAAAGETFLVADGEDLSTPQMIQLLAAGLGRAPRLWPFPVEMLRRGAGLLGKAALCDSLCSSLQVDAGKARTLLGWRPRVSTAEGLARTAHWYREARGA